MLSSVSIEAKIYPPPPLGGEVSFEQAQFQCRVRPMQGLDYVESILNLPPPFKPVSLQLYAYNRINEIPFSIQITMINISNSNEHTTHLEGPAQFLNTLQYTVQYTPNLES